MSHYKFHNDCQSSVLTYEQVKRLDFVMDQTVPIHGRGIFPTLYVKLKELIRLVKHKLQKEHSIEIRDVRLNGGTANYVLAPENSQYNDLDLIFGIDLSDEDRFDVIRDVVLDCLREFYPKEPAVDGGSGTAGSSSSSSRCCNEHQQQQQQQQQQQPNDACRLFGTSAAAATATHQAHESDQQPVDEGGVKRRMSEGSANLNNCDNLSVKDVAEDASDNTGLRVRCGVKPSAVEHSRTAADNEANQSQDRNESSRANATETSVKQQQQQQQQQSLQMPPNNCAIKEAYVHKMVKVNDDDRWSLISLGVQQSEVNNCGHQATGGATHCSGGCGEKYFSQKALVDQPCDANSQSGAPEQHLPANIGGAKQCGAATIINQQNHHYHNHHNHHYQQHNNHHHQQQQQQQHQQHQQPNRPKQFPNSIELKFVDRMRRKFEFSVDSFQIILDSLIQFYDYAPKPSIASQRNLMNSHPSSTVINTRPMNMSKRRCSSDCCYRRCCAPDCARLDSGDYDGSHFKVKMHPHRDEFTTNRSCHNLLMSSSSDTEFNSRASTKTCGGSGVGGGSSGGGGAPGVYYHQFGLESSANSPSLVSEASSSGCSSSSSVVSSSSSSLYCDEDHEDLYGDADGQSSSSASTSSLLSSSTAISSVYSSDGGRSSVAAGAGDSTTAAAAQRTSLASSKSNKKQQTNENHSEKINHRRSQLTDPTTTSTTTTTPNLAPKTSSTDVEATICASCRASYFGHLHRHHHHHHHHLNSNNNNRHNHHHHHYHQSSTTINNDDDDDDAKSQSFDECDFETNDRTSCAVISENFYPTVIGRSEYGEFKEALYHLEKKLIATRSPEEIRGGGLLKYCNLLVKNYKPTNVYQIRTLERYMCSRFFIDFSDLNQQKAKLESYLANHFSDELMLKIDYLTILHNVVQRSTVCLMNHELRLTLEMIRDMAFKLNEQQQQGQLNRSHQLQRSQQLQSATAKQNSQAKSEVKAPTAQQHHQHHNQAHQHLHPANQPPIQAQQQPKLNQHYYQPQKPLLIQSGVYRVKLVNYSLAKPAVH